MNIQTETMLAAMSQAATSHVISSWEWEPVTWVQHAIVTGDDDKETSSSTITGYYLPIETIIDDDPDTELTLLASNGPGSNGTLQWIKRTARKIGSYIPTVCGGGLFNYYGGAAGVPDATVAIAKWQQADTRSGYSTGVFTELSSGEGITLGLGQQGPLGGDQEHYLFLGAGGNAGIASGNVSLFGSDSASTGLALEGSVGRWTGGVGVYANFDSVTSCIDHGGR